jgi:soluble lytic murein transglycosylase
MAAVPFKLLIVGFLMIPSAFAQDSCHNLFSQLSLSTEWKLIKSSIDAQACPLQYKVLKWSALSRGDEDLSLKDYIEFIETHPTWPWIHKIAEQAEKKKPNISQKALGAWFGKYFPKTPQGSKIYLDYYLSLPATSKKLTALKKLWVKGNLMASEEQRLFKFLEKHLTLKEKIQRIHYYLDQKQGPKAEKLAKRLTLKGPPADLIQERILLQKGKESASFYAHGGFLLDKLTYYRQSYSPKAYKLSHQAKNLMYQYDPERTWKEIHILIRRLLEDSQFKEAYALLKGHQGLTGASLLDALWLEGWLSHQLYSNPLVSLEYFKKLYIHAKTPISLAKGAFWAGDICSSQNPKESRAWFMKAARFPTTFYGQEALKRLKIPLKLPKDAKPTPQDLASFKTSSLIKIAQILVNTPLQKEIKTFLYMALKGAKTKGERLLILAFAQKHIPEEAVSLAKETSYYHEVYGDVAYPLLKGPYAPLMGGVDPALVHSVIRKESSFNSRLMSPKGAMGLMQLMPGTAKMVAKEQQIPFQERDLLHKKDLNIALGSAYLGRNLGKYGDNLILTLASYNAGPKPTQDWIQRFGDPREKIINPLAWIEIIPYGETRNYIHRVLEAYRIYHIKLTRSPKGNTL